MPPALSEKKKDYIAKIEFFYKPLGNNVEDYKKQVSTLLRMIKRNGL